MFKHVSTFIMAVVFIACCASSVMAKTTPEQKGLHEMDAPVAAEVLMQAYDDSIVLMEKIVKHLKTNRLWAAPLTKYSSFVWSELEHRVRDLEGEYEMDLNNDYIIIRRH